MTDDIYPFFGWGPNMTNYPSGDPTEVYQVDLSAGQLTKWGTFRQECMTNARVISARCERLYMRIRLLVSGGMDSHSMLLSFVLQNIPVEACVYAVYKDDKIINQDDFDRAQAICTKYNVPTNVVYIDITNWDQTTDAESIAEGMGYSERNDLGLFLRRVAADHFKGEFVVMVGDMHTIGYMPSVDPHDFVAIFKPLNPTPTPFAAGSYGVSCFHQMRRSSMLAYLEDPVLSHTTGMLAAMYPSFQYIADPKKLGMLQGGVKFYEYLFKPQIFTNNWPEMEVHPKATGLESIDFTKDEGAIDITTIQLERSIVRPIRKLLQDMYGGDVHMKSSDKHCERLIKFGNKK